MEKKKYFGTGNILPINCLETLYKLLPKNEKLLRISIEQILEDGIGCINFASSMEPPTPSLSVQDWSEEECLTPRHHVGVNGLRYYYPENYMPKGS